MNFGIKDNSISNSDPNCPDKNQQSNSDASSAFSLLLTEPIILESELREPSVSVVDASTVQGTIDRIKPDNLIVEKSY